MASMDPADVRNDPVYQELLDEHRSASPEAIETALQFLRVAAKLNLGQEAKFNEFGLTSGRFGLLMLLRREPERALSPSELAKRTSVSRATMTQFIDALEKDGWVRRVDDPDDRRAMRVELTSKGDGLLKRVLPEHLKSLTHFSEALTRPERKQLLKLLEKVSESFSTPDAG